MIARVYCCSHRSAAVLNGTGIMKYEMQNRRENMKNLKDYLKMIVTAVTCFLMGFVKREKEYDWKLGNVWRNTGNNVVWDNPKCQNDFSIYCKR